MERILLAIVVALTLLGTTQHTQAAQEAPATTYLHIHYDFSRVCNSPAPSYCYQRTFLLQWVADGNRTYYYNTTDQNGEAYLTLPFAWWTLQWWIQADQTLAYGSNIFNEEDIWPSGVGGDANTDNVVNSVDFTIVRNAFGTGCGNPLYDSRADFNRDCLVGNVDFNILKTTYGTGGPGQW